MSLTSALVSTLSRCHWVEPVLVAQVKFTEWTNDGQLRQPVAQEEQQVFEAGTEALEVVAQNARIIDILLSRCFSATRPILIALPVIVGIVVWIWHRGEWLCRH